MTGWGTGWGAKPAQEAAIKQANEMISTQVVSIQKFLNKKPTHDPYTNPNAHIYYECKCGAILDPGTKSFAALNNCASEKGWKVRWGAEAYQPYCPKCGESVE